MERHRHMAGHFAKAVDEDLARGVRDDETLVPLAEAKMRHRASLAKRQRCDVSRQCRQREPAEEEQVLLVQLPELDTAVHMAGDDKPAARGARHGPWPPTHEG